MRNLPALASGDRSRHSVEIETWLSWGRGRNLGHELAQRGRSRKILAGCPAKAAETIRADAGSKRPLKDEQ